MKLVLTGGHLSPALAVLEALPKETQVVFIGRQFALEGDDAVSLEKRAIERLGIPFYSITTGRMQRKFTKYTLFSLSKLPIGFFQSYTILKKEKPNAIVTFGGYISIPVAVAAFFLKIPVVIHEQTLEAGFANKVLSSIAKKICISWESNRAHFPKRKVVLTGNPLRKEFLNSKKEELGFINNDFKNEKLPCIYVTGGSLGSHAINELVEQSLQALLHDYKIVHQTGDARQFGDFERLSAVKNKLPKSLQNRYILTRFVMPHEVVSLMQEADLVVSRSGINTITELIYLNKMSLLIPLPISQNNEQKKNALYLKGLGLGEIIDQETTSSSHFRSVVDGMIKNKKKYTLGDPANEVQKSKEAAEKIVDVILSV